MAKIYLLLLIILFSIFWGCRKSDDSSIQSLERIKEITFKPNHLNYTIRYIYNYDSEGKIISVLEQQLDGDSIRREEESIVTYDDNTIEMISPYGNIGYYKTILTKEEGLIIKSETFIKLDSKPNWELEGYTDLKYENDKLVYTNFVNKGNRERSRRARFEDGKLVEINDTALISTLYNLTHKVFKKNYHYSQNKLDSIVTLEQTNSAFSSFEKKIFEYNLNQINLNRYSFSPTNQQWEVGNLTEITLSDYGNTLEETSSNGDTVIIVYELGYGNLNDIIYNELEKSLPIPIIFSGL